MKKQLLILSFLLLDVVVFAQTSNSNGGTQLNAGFGLSSWGLPVYVGLDFGVHKDITVGGELSYRSYNENLSNQKYNSSIIGISGNGNYHFNNVLNMSKNWDLYAGLNLGYYIWNTPKDYTGTNSSSLGLGGQLGIRYFLSKKVGLNLEFGGGNAFSGGKFGLTFKL